MSRLEGQSPLQSQERINWLDRDDSEANPVEVEYKETMSETFPNNSTVTREVQIINKMGLHARPAMQFVDLANKYTSRITVCKNAQCVNAKSIMELLLLAATAGTKLVINAEGSDAREAAEALAVLVAGKFGEE
jgi:phosphocarrier protein